MAKCRFVWFSAAIVVLFKGIMCIPEQGILSLEMVEEDDKARRWSVSKSMYAGTVVALDINGSCANDVPIKVRWIISTFKCADHFQGDSTDGSEQLITRESGDDYLRLEFEGDVTCSPSQKTIVLPNWTMNKWMSKQSDLQTGKPSDSPDFSNDSEENEENSVDETPLGNESANDDDEEEAENSESSPEEDKPDTKTSPAPTKQNTKDVAKSSPQSNTEKKSTKSDDEPDTKTSPAPTKQNTKDVHKSNSSRKPAKIIRRAAIDPKPVGVMKNTTPVTVDKSDSSIDIPGAIAKVPVDGLYHFEGTVSFSTPPAENFTVTVKFISSYGYLSAIEFPFLPFYAVLCAVYAIFLLTWLILCCCYCRDILRIQLWIAAVVFIGFVEEATFLGEYHVLNQTGQSVPGAVHFGEMISCVKRALARVLVIIASVGFGIVKPRLGPTLPKVLGVGIGYFILSAVDGYMRANTHKANHQESSEIIFIGILAVTDAAICWWIFTALIQTTRTLRLRRNLVKLSLYRHFTNTLIFSVIASVGFMLWSIIVHKFTKCLTDWKELWVEDAFWQLLFTIILLVMMILWRPSASNQRYAYSPLSDGADDDAEEPMMNEAFEGMKMRGSKTDVNNTRKHSADHADEDLKWIDDNIPPSVADSALPGLLDSEEEIMNTKYELSKMQ